MEFIVYRGSDYSIPVTLTNSDNSAYDLTGCELFLTIKRNFHSNDLLDNDALLKYSAGTGTSTPIPNPTLGVYTFTLPSADTETLDPTNYYIGMRLKSALGKIEPGPEGTLSVKETTTRRTS